MNYIYDKNGNVVSTDQNLRGIIERNRKDQAVNVQVRAAKEGKGIFFALWSNGDRTAVLLDSYDAAVGFSESATFSTAAIGAQP